MVVTTIPTSAHTSVFIKFLNNFCVAGTQKTARGALTEERIIRINLAPARPLAEKLPAFPQSR